MTKEADGLTKAILYSAAPPDKRQEFGFKEFISEKYGADIELVWEKSDVFPGGFRLEIGAEVYDWSVNGRFQQLRDTLTHVPVEGGNVIPLLKESLKLWTPKAMAQEIGTVLSVGDGIAIVEGLDNVTYGEILLFSAGVRGMVQDIRKDQVGCILFDDDGEITEESTVHRTAKTAGIPVGEAFLGRVVNGLGVPVDGKGEIASHDYYPIESPAPGIIERQPVNKPLETGILAIDSMFPIGKGQRELIIGDRQTGKTAIALDTILNQKNKNVVCIYVAIGQKTSSVVKLTETLKKYGALDYTVIINASASDAAPLQYIAPYAGCSMGEYFMRQGKDVLIVYDDLSKHAVAYRALSLLLDRSPGREAYPGDVFYLHSRLLERSACMSDEMGGGTMTALPIVETQAGDVSAYIPTNIISITDGQIFLEDDLFFEGQRPAINVGLSVSRVGGDAQTKAMKKASGALRLDLAQYREMEVFTQFASDLDEITRKQLAYGQGLMRLLRQSQYHSFKQHEQVIILVAALNHVMQNVDVENIQQFIKELLFIFDTDYYDLCQRIEETGQLSDEDKEQIITISKKFASKFDGK